MVCRVISIVGRLLRVVFAYPTLTRPFPAWVSTNKCQSVFQLASLSFRLSKVAVFNQALRASWYPRVQLLLIQ